jgi:hypothetical protein
MISCLAFTVTAVVRPIKILLPASRPTGGQPMLSYKKAERWSNRKRKNTIAHEKVKGGGDPKLWISVKHHAAQFHD